MTVDWDVISAKQDKEKEDEQARVGGPRRDSSMTRK